MPRQYDFISAEDLEKILDQQPGFRCPVCKATMLTGADGKLLCSTCKGNAIQGQAFGLGFSEAVVKVVAPRSDQKELAGLARVHMHWQMRVRPVFFKGPMGGVAPSVIRDLFVGYVRENILETAINCCNCDEMLRDSDPDNPLACPSCGGQEVEARSVVLEQIAHSVNRQFKSN